MALRYLVPALAVAGSAAAAACSGTSTLSNQADATALASCSQFTGDIWLDKGIVGDISLDFIQRLDGSLLARDCPKLTSLSASSLSVISKTFGLDTVSTLTSLNFPSLVNVNEILWQGLPALQGLSFSQSVQQASVLSIQNTQLNSLEGIDLMTVDELILANNNFLDDVTMQLGNVTQLMSFSSNGRNLNVQLPNLEWAYNATFRNVSSLNIDSLSYVNSSLGFYSNFFDTISAPNLTQITKGTLAFVSNGALTNISMPAMRGIGGALQIANNTNLKTIDGFPRLSQVLGAVDMFGEFKSVELPDINLVQGAFNIESTEDLGSTCSKFQAKSGPNNDLRGKFNCQGGQQSPGKGTSLPNSGDSGSSGSSGANSLLIPYATGVIGLVAAVFGML